MNNDFRPPYRGNSRGAWSTKHKPSARQTPAAPVNPVIIPSREIPPPPDHKLLSARTPRFRPTKRYLLLLPVILAFISGVWWVNRDSENGFNIPVISQGDNNQTEQPEEKTFDKSKYSIDKADSIWVVTNKSRPLSPLKYVPSDLIDAGGGQQMRKEVAVALQKMISTAEKEGLYLQPQSGYRSYETQEAVYASEVARNGQAVADTQSAKPGHSEHQTGLGMDLGGGGCGIEDCFGDTAEGKWVAANAYKYGFVVRYVPGKEDITGYRPEPWHVRYVGKDLAAEMKKQNIKTLEEFFGL